MYAAVFLVFEQMEPMDKAAAVAAQPSRLLFITGKKTKQQFVVDNGASISIISQPHNFKGQPSEYGEMALYLDLGLQYKWMFIILRII